MRGGDHQRAGGTGVLRGAGRGDGRVRRRFEPVYGGFSLQTAAFWEHFGRGKPGPAGGIFPENAGGKGPKDLKNP